MSLIRKHVAVLQAWACLALVRATFILTFNCQRPILSLLSKFVCFDEDTALCPCTYKFVVQ